MNSQKNSKLISQKILVIDDDEKFTDDLQFLLKGPYRFTTVTESKRGIELLQKEKFDLVILDLAMPAFFASDDEKEGIEVLRKIKANSGIENEKKIPVVILTKMNTPENRKICLELKADGFFTKPPVIEVLNNKIDKLLSI